MTRIELNMVATELVSQITAANASKRMALQPKLQQVVAAMEAEGITVPGRLRALDDDLTDEIIEARFDNFPV